MDGTRKTHTTSDIRITNRDTATLCGVDEIFSYDENSVVLSLCGVRTVVEGENLKVTELSVENGRISLAGRINAVICEDDVPLRKGFFGSLFRGKS